MVRKFTINDLDSVMKIWFETNMQAHSFIPAMYWQNNYAKVKEILPEAEIYVFEDENTKQVIGFIGLMKNYIAAVFTIRERQSHSIGKQLMDYVKKNYSALTLTVYQKNPRAIAFYERENFRIQAESLDKSTNEKEFIMTWAKK